MQKLKKALKKLTSFGKKSEAKGPAKAAKKAASVKRKTQTVASSAKTAKAGVAKKAPAKKAAVATKAKASPKAAAAAAKAEAKEKEAKKKAVAKAAAPTKAAAEKEEVAPKTRKKAAAAKVTPAVKAPVAKPAKEQKKSEAKEVALPAVTTTPVQADEEVILTDAEGRRYCRVKDCDQVANVEAYCRYHYLLYWKNIQNRKKILSEGKLERYIEELTARYPDKYLELLRKDLRSEKDFMAAIQELEIDDSSADTEFEDESYLDEVRGMSADAGADRDDEF